MDNRAQSVGIARLALSLVGGAAVYWVVDETTSAIFPYIADASDSAKADTATSWFQTGIELMPIGFAVIAFFGLIILSVYQSGRL